MTTTATETEADPFTPCRTHIMDLLFALPPKLRAIAHWRMTPDVWERIKKDHQFASNHSIVCGGPALLDIPVYLDGRHPGTVELIIPADCQPSMHPREP